MTSWAKWSFRTVLSKAILQPQPQTDQCMWLSVPLYPREVHSLTRSWHFSRIRVMPLLSLDTHLSRARQNVQKQWSRQLRGVSCLLISQTAVLVNLEVIEMGQQGWDATPDLTRSSLLVGVCAQVCMCVCARAQVCTPVCACVEVRGWYLVPSSIPLHLTLKKTSLIILLTHQLTWCACPHVTVLVWRWGDGFQSSVCLYHKSLRKYFYLLSHFTSPWDRTLSSWTWGLSFQLNSPAKELQQSSCSPKSHPQHWDDRHVPWSWQLPGLWVLWQQDWGLAGDLQ